MKTIQDTSTKSQREFVLARLKERPHSTNELRIMGIYSPPARIKELRQKGYSIDTLWQKETDPSGISHRVGLYVLSQSTSEEGCT